MRRRGLALLACLLLATSAHAAKIVGVTVNWVPPTQNTDGTPLTNLAAIAVQWGTCAATGAFGTQLGQVTVNVPATSAVIVPAGTPPFCFEAEAITTSGLVSAWSNVAEWSPPGTLGQPATLGQPVQLSNVIHFNFNRKVKS